MPKESFKYQNFAKTCPAPALRWSVLSVSIFTYLFEGISGICWIFAKFKTKPLVLAHHLNKTKKDYTQYMRFYVHIYNECVSTKDSRFLSLDLIDLTRGYFPHCTEHKLVFVRRLQCTIAQPGSPSLSIHQGNVSKKAPHNRHPHPFCSAKPSLWYLGSHF